MTLREAEDIAAELRRTAKLPVDEADLARRAAEAIDYLLAELELADNGLLGMIEWVGPEGEP